MAESVKVFKNQNDVVPSDMNAAIDYTILTTSSTERAVIKDVSVAVEGAGAGRVTPTLDLDGFTITTAATGTSLLVDGTLIMGPSSTLKVKATPTTGFTGDNYFRGMFFSGGSNTGIQYLEGDGVTASSITPTFLTSSNIYGASAVATMVGGTRFYYVYAPHNQTIYKYAEQATSSTHSWTHGGTGEQMTTDGTYIYRSGSSNKIYRTQLSNHATSTLTTNQTYYGPSDNQGSYFLYHDGKIYSKENGNTSTVYVITLSTLNVTTLSDSDFSVGSYSDGACVVTTTAGVSYIVEQGTSYYSYYNIAEDEITRVSGGGGSTEYGNGAAEVAPGVALIFGEQDDNATVIDMNPSTPTRTRDDGSHQYTTHYQYGNKFAFAGFLWGNQPAALEFKYSVFASGIFIEE